MDRVQNLCLPLPLPLPLVRLLHPKMAGVQHHCDVQLPGISLCVSDLTFGTPL